MDIYEEFLTRAIDLTNNTESGITIKQVENTAESIGMSEFVEQLINEAHQ